MLVHPQIQKKYACYDRIFHGAPKEHLTLLKQVRCRWEVELYIMRKFEIPSLHSIVSTLLAVTLL
jgi:hypothetical protein